MDYKTLFPVLEAGFFFLGYPGETCKLYWLRILERKIMLLNTRNYWAYIYVSVVCVNLRYFMILPLSEPSIIDDTFYNA